MNTETATKTRRFLHLQTRVAGQPWKTIKVASTERTMREHAAAVAANCGTCVDIRVAVWDGAADPIWDNPTEVLLSRKGER